jgi:hypothetical protein
LDSAAALPFQWRLARSGGYFVSNLSPSRKAASGARALVYGVAALGGLAALYGSSFREPAATTEGAQVSLWTYAAAAAVLAALGA